MFRAIFFGGLLVFCGVVSTPAAALPDGWSAVASGGITDPLEVSPDDRGNLSSELILQAARTWDIDENWSFQVLGQFETERETARRFFNLSDTLTLGAVIRYRMDCCGTLSSGVRYTSDWAVISEERQAGLSFGVDHVVFKKVAGEWSSPRIFFGWSNIRFPGSLGGEAQNWVAQGRYEMSQGFEIRPLGAAPSIYSGLAFTVDREGLSFNNKIVPDVGLRLSWKIKKTTLTFDVRAMRDRRFRSDELYIGRQVRLGFRHVF